MSYFLPADPAEVAAHVAEAAAARTPLSIVGLASKAALGRPVKNAGRLDLSRLAGVTFYEPEELVVSALAGTPIENHRRRCLPKTRRSFPSSPCPLRLFMAPGSGTLGGCLMTNLSGPRRIKAGAARDFVLGFKAVSGPGRSFQGRRPGREECHRL